MNEAARSCDSAIFYTLALLVKVALHPKSASILLEENTLGRCELIRFLTDIIPNGSRRVVDTRVLYIIIISTLLNCAESMICRELGRRKPVMVAHLDVVAHVKSGNVL